ncbi:MAG: type IV toxin-antitoxin system AbiEi family antitoxin [Melioribacteraceae bacterium]|nr:type IV toxin-antitoxin system AbiEi family antitoxin [Melioribacteraceae bacterium]
MNTTKRNIINKAITRFGEETGIRLTLYITGERVDIVLREKEYDLTFVVEVTPVINKTKLGIIKNHLKGFENIPLLISWIIKNDTAELLKNLNINFIDAAGNAYINVPPLFINIKGQKLTQNISMKQAVNNAEKDTGLFQPAGLRIIFALLCNPKLERNPFREIAEMANVALGTVHATMKLLEKYGFIIDVKTQGKILTNKKELLKEWILGYPEKIKHKYIVGKYLTENQEFVKTTDFKYFGALLGGETAAAQITNFLRPVIHTVYIGDKIGEFVLRNRLKKNPNGNVEIVKKFWNFNEDNEINDLAPMLLIYSDLITSGDPRNIETASIIYESQLVRYLN